MTTEQPGFEEQVAAHDFGTPITVEPLIIDEDPIPEASAFADAEVVAAEDEFLYLDAEQARRVEALQEAHSLLTTEVKTGGGMFGSITSDEDRLLVPAADLPAALKFLADYILDGGEASIVRPFVVYVEASQISDVRVHGVAEGGVIIIPREGF